MKRSLRHGCAMRAFVFGLLTAMPNAPDGNRVGEWLDEPPQRLTAKTPTHDAEQATKARRLAWLAQGLVDDEHGVSLRFFGSSSMTNGTDE